jgi:hypothetical protein
MKKLADRTVPEKRKQALLKALPIQPKHSQSGQSGKMPQSFPGEFAA